MLDAEFRRPVLVEGVFDDPGLVRSLIERHGPYAPVERYFASVAEAAATNPVRSVDVEKSADESPSVSPNFRGDWAHGVPLVDGAERIMRHAGFAAAVQRLYGGTPVIVPDIVFVNITAPMAAQPMAHTDVPAFRGIERTEYPTWFLQMMGRSRLFEDFRVRIATAVAWFYEGQGGGLRFWPDGPDAASEVVEPPFSNTALVGDNDFMFHQVEAIGDAALWPLPGRITAAARLGRRSSAGNSWAITEGGRAVREYQFEQLRVSISWKAFVYADDEERRSHVEHGHDVTLGQVLSRFAEDAAARGRSLPMSSAPLRDPDFITALSAAYRVGPTAP